MVTEEVADPRKEVAVAEEPVGKKPGVAFLGSSAEAGVAEVETAEEGIGPCSWAAAGTPGTSVARHCIGWGWTFPRHERPDIPAG